MKKTISLTLVLVMLLSSFCSCNGKKPDESAGNINKNDNNYNQSIEDDNGGDEQKTDLTTFDNNYNQNIEDDNGGYEQKTDPTTLDYDYNFWRGHLPIAVDEFGNAYTFIAEFNMYYSLPNGFDGEFFYSVMYRNFAWAMCYEQSPSDSTQYEFTICKFICGSEATETYTLICNFENLHQIHFSFYNETEGHIFLWRESNDGGNVLCLKTNDGGKTWTPVQIEFPKVYDSVEGYPSFVKFASDDVGIISYTYHVEKHHGGWNDVFDATYLTTDGGLTWNRISLRSPFSMKYIEWFRVSDLYKDGDSYVLNIKSSTGGCLFRSDDKFNWNALGSK